MICHNSGDVQPRLGVCVEHSHRSTPRMPVAMAMPNTASIEAVALSDCIYWICRAHIPREKVLCLLHSATREGGVLARKRLALTAAESGQAGAADSSSTTLIAASWWFAVTDAILRWVGAMAADKQRSQGRGHGARTWELAARHCRTFLCCQSLLQPCRVVRAFVTVRVFWWRCTSGRHAMREVG